MSAFSDNPIVMQLGKVGLFREWLKDSAFDYRIGAIDIIERQDGSEELTFDLNRGDSLVSTFDSVDAALRFLADPMLTSAFENYLHGFTRKRLGRLQDPVGKI
ncbi:hypothetical protein SAMN06265795_104292 [Noviherbaspirillum humi]|uniref:Uncharacterized protein n=1 Tax=Noviherbaspirillum humi TaxID=1688639 RepID=A0A239G852_9BURK|nr:hypothetical protein [Noviherbaspirillum humi]SNS65290.1 hypothetical protein SAMN06265795_104292 [Noviherbaspirillum humi]